MAKTKSPGRSWLVPRLKPEVWVAFVLFLLAVAGHFAIFTDLFHLYPGDVPNSANRLYLLSAVAQSLAAILAVLVTLTLVSAQLAASSYTPRIVRLKIKDPWFWVAVGIYTIAILGAFLAKAWLNALLNSPWDIWSVDLVILWAGLALLYLVPFFIATMRGLRPESIVRALLKKGQADALIDLMRKAVNDGSMTTLRDGLGGLAGRFIASLKKGQAGEKEAQEFAAYCLDVGRYACRKGDVEACEVVMRHLTALTKACTKARLREAADVFNDAAGELYNYSLEKFGE